MKKIIVYMLMIILIMFAVSSCQNLLQQEDQQEAIEKLKEKALSSFEDGDLKSAEEDLEQVLSQNPEDPNANAAMSFISFYKALREVDSLFKTTDNRFAYKVWRFFRVEDQPSFDVGNVLYNVKRIQDKLDSDIIPILEQVLTYTNVAAKGDVEIKLYVNKVDWDGDGEREPTTSLRLKFISSITGVSTSVNISSFYKCEEVHIGSFDKVEIDTSGGDAIFDYELFEKGLLGKDACDIPKFDDNDYITIDEGEVYALKAFVEFVLSYFDAFTVYNFNLPDDAINAMNLAINSENFIEFLEYIDGDSNKVVEYSEWKGKLGTFLSFRKKGAEHLKNAVTNFGETFEDYLKLLNEISSDDSGKERHNLTSKDFIPEEIYNLNDEDKKDIENIIDYTLGNTPFEVKDYEGELIARVKFYKLREAPNNFSDLKEFLPKIEYAVDSSSVPATILEFPDTTFGGLIEWVESLETPIPIHISE